MAANLAAISMVSMLVLTGCERRISSANIDAANRQQEVAATRTIRSTQVKEGLTLKEVESVLGQPAWVETEKRPILVQKNLELTRWYYEQDGQTIELLFVDGNLQRRIPQFGEAPGKQIAPPRVVAPGTIGAAASQP
jgi:hypothetical protein